MKEKVIKRLNEEMELYKESLKAGNLTATQLIEEAYQIVMKQFIVESMEQLYEEDMMEDELWEHLDSKISVLEYLYQLWMHGDFSVPTALMEVLQNEVEHDTKK